MRMFEFSLSYRLDSDFPATYLDEDLTKIIRSPIYPFKDRKQVPIVWVVLNCHAANGREYYVKELLKYIDIDIYIYDYSTIKLPDLIKQYTFENLNCDYYVTEKLFNAFLASVINIVDELASYILSFSESEQAYSSYLSYKNNDMTLSKEFIKYWQGYNHKAGIFGYDFRGGRCNFMPTRE
ncbi:Glycosyltransferase Family 10 protein [Gigaspora rosea]|uniref:Fucosyltransferase n=1 Tax=Gigaspora rosea TaxID=44941 RepID=A0A397U7T7_9GLOM|nr:Glycosyltransferase Family 10 protein [Gigaspora rosea]